MSARRNTIRQIPSLIVEDRTVLNEFVEEYIDPDKFYGKQGAVPFIYSPDGSVVYGFSADTHWDLVAYSSKLFKQYGNRKDVSGNMLNLERFKRVRKAMMANGELIGRIGVIDGDSESIPDGTGVASFWNNKPDAYQNLSACLSKFIADGKLAVDAYVSTPVHGTIPISELTQKTPSELSSEANEKHELAQQMHLMTGAAKMDAMKQLGVGGRAKNKWQDAMEKAGIINPGQKWQTPTSEGLAKKLDAIFEWEDEDQDEEPEKLEYLNPDDFYDTIDAVPFIYTADGGLYYSPDCSDTHGDVNRSHQDLIDRYGRTGARDKGPRLGDLLGRIGDGPWGRTVSFWNDDYDVYNSSLKACLKELNDEGLIDVDGYVSTPVHGTIPIEGLVNFKTRPITPEMAEKLELAKQMHLMRGDQKRDAMKKLGVGGQKPHPMQTAMVNAGLLKPGQKWWAPHSEMRQSSHEILNEFDQGEMTTAVDKFIDPDKFYLQDGAVPFIYTTENMLYFGSKDNTHWQIIRRTPQLIARYEPITRQYHAKAYPSGADAMKVGDLVGRIGKSKHGRTVSFWNQDQHAYANLGTCLTTLIKNGFVGTDGYVSTPVHGTIPITGVAKAESKPITPETAEMLELAKQMHLMRGDQKRDAMKKLGVDGGGRPHPMQRALDKAGLRIPGQKWQTPHSENFVEKLDGVLKEWEGPKTNPNARVANFIDPDILRSRNLDFLTFIYTSDGELHSIPYSPRGGDLDDSRHDVIMAKLSDRYASNKEIVDPVEAGEDGSADDATRRRAESMDLFGRVGVKTDFPARGQQALIVSFWNARNSLYDNFLIPCLEALDKEGHLGNEKSKVYVSTPQLSTVPLESVYQRTTQTKELTADELENLELQKKLHLMTGDQKRDAMKKLGVGGGGKPHPMQAALDKSGLRVPGQKWWAPQSEGRQLKSTLVEFDQSEITAMIVQHKDEFIDPDTFYGDFGATTFIYTHDGEMFYADGEISHGILAATEMADRYLNESSLEYSSSGSASPLYRKDIMKYGDLLGRIGDYGFTVVAFWNTEPAHYERLQACVEQLIDDKKIDISAAISTPLHKTFPVTELDQAQVKTLTDEEAEKVRLQRELHLMRGAEKRDAMKKLGVGGQKPHPMQTALDKAGLRIPGQKWWAPNSENLVRKLDVILGTTSR